MLTKQLIGLEGWRVEVRDWSYSKPRRFIVGISTGPMPIHLECSFYKSEGGYPAERTYASVIPIRKVWWR